MDNLSRKCPVCNDDGWVEVGDRPGLNGYPEATAVTCPCSGGDELLLTDRQMEVWESQTFFG
jgi:hypothetical protein